MLCLCWAQELLDKQQRRIDEQERKAMEQARLKIQHEAARMVRVAAHAHAHHTQCARQDRSCRAGLACGVGHLHAACFEMHAY